MRETKTTELKEDNANMKTILLEKLKEEEEVRSNERSCWLK